MNLPLNTYECGEFNSLFSLLLFTPWLCYLHVKLIKQNLNRQLFKINVNVMVIDEFKLQYQYQRISIQKLDLKRFCNVSFACCAELPESIDIKTRRYFFLKCSGFNG